MLHVFFTGDSIYYRSLLYVRQKAIWSMLQVSLSKILAKYHLVPNILLDVGNKGKPHTKVVYCGSLNFSELDSKHVNMGGLWGGLKH